MATNCSASGPGTSRALSARLTLGGDNLVSELLSVGAQLGPVGGRGERRKVHVRLGSAGMLGRMALASWLPLRMASAMASRLLRIWSWLLRIWSWPRCMAASNWS